YHVALVRDTGVEYIYVDGKYIKSRTCPTVGNNQNIYLGSGYSANFQGEIDEFRVSEVARSADWVWAEWRNMDAPTSFATFGEAGLSNPDLARINNVSLLSRSGVSAQVVGELITNGVDQATVRLFWGPIDGGTNAAVWLAGGGASLEVGFMADGAIFTNTISGLVMGETYFWNYCAINSTSTAWGRALGSPSFKTLSTPVVSNGAVTDIRSFKVTVSGELTDGAAATVELLIGTEDGVWQRSLPLGEVEEGGFSGVINGLRDNTTYFVTVLATNICGSTVAAPSLSFTTRNSATVLASSGIGYVDIGTPDALQLPANAPFTIEGWVLFKSLTTRDMLYSKSNARSNGPYSYLVGFADNKLAAYNTAWRGNFAVSRQLNRWYHTAFSFDGTNMAFYLDGELLGTAAFTYTQTATHSVKIGGYSSSSDGNGYKSDVRIWDYARSGDEIRSTMERRLYGNEPGLLGYWPLYDGEGLTAFDATANGSDGVLEGAVWATDSTLVLTPPHIPFLYAPSFILSDPVTGSASFTSSNEVELTDVIVPDGYDCVQIGFTGDIIEIDPDGWLDIDALPERIVFEQPQTDTNMTVYLWFSNKVESATVRRAEASIRYTTVAPVAQVWPTLTRVFAPPTAAVITPELVDRGSSGGVSGGDEIGIWLRSLNLLAGPDTNATPDEAWVTVSTPGVYNVELVVVNEAGNVATSAMCAVEVLAVGTTASTFYVDKNWTGAELGTATAPYRTIRTAVEAANLTTTEPNTIYIAAGWYGDGANGGSEDYKNGGAADGGIVVTRRTEFYGGYAGWQGGATFDWEARTPRATVIDLDKANSRAFYCNRSAESRIVALFDGLT
ncbi:MAG: LamG domain-containing protein, partial [Lentisphaerae bacterium]|nr:LamG domain-containing protein [Lentisphaerota bacterium]